MLIRIDPHTLERAEERGVTRAEIEDVILTGSTIPAKGNRKAREKVFEFNRRRAGVFYEHKKVQVVFVVEADLASTVTVYVFYGRWEG